MSLDIASVTIAPGTTTSAAGINIDDRELVALRLYSDRTDTFVSFLCDGLPVQGDIGPAAIPYRAGHWPIDPAMARAITGLVEIRLLGVTGEPLDAASNLEIDLVLAYR